MVPEIKKILYATDLSESARHAFGYAADLAQRYGAMMTILYVMENMSHLVENEVKETIGQKEWDKLKFERLNYVTEKTKARLEDFCREMNSVPTGRSNGWAMMSFRDRKAVVAWWYCVSNPATWFIGAMARDESIEQAIRPPMVN